MGSNFGDLDNKNIQLNKILTVSWWQGPWLKQLRGSDRNGALILVLLTMMFPSQCKSWCIYYVTKLHVKCIIRDFKIRDYPRLDARSPMSGGLHRVWCVVARKHKLICYTTNYVLREIAAVELTLKMSFQKVRDELIYCFADGILDEEEFVLLYDAYKSTNSIYPYWEYDEFSLDSLSSDECLADFRPSSRASSSTYPSIWRAAISLLIH